MVQINNLTNTKVSKEFLRKISKLVLDREEKKKSNLSIILVSQQMIQRLNKRYRGEDRVTDVLSFGLKGKEKFILPPDKSESKEILLCLKEINKNAKKFGTTFKKELASCLIHGILHLLGYSHEKNKNSTRIMREKEKFYLNLFFK